MKYIASVSGGKDSIAMFYLILSQKKPLDAVVFYNTGMEFEIVLQNIYFVRETCKKQNIEFIELKPEKPFIYNMIERPVKNHFGYGWCGGVCRWGTALKQKALDTIPFDYKYIGIAKDEPERYSRLSKNQIAPLYDCGITEKQALSYCRWVGFDWIENGVDLYDILDRVSCWCCRNKNQKELYRIWRYLPEYWEKLLELQKHLPDMKNFHNKNFGDFGNLFRMQEVFENKFFDKYKIEKYER